MGNLKENKILFFGKILWLYTKYQLLTKTILLLIIFPLFTTISKTLIYSTGRVSVSSGDYIRFLFSFQGLGLLISALVVLILLIGIDINAFIIISALIKEKKIKLTARTLVLVGIKSLKSFLNLSGILIMIYIALIIPLVGVGLSVSVTKNFKIPNFITDVIYNNGVYFTIYGIVLLILTIITLIHIFFFHYLLIDGQSVKNALKKSSSLMKRHWKSFIKEIFIKLGLIYVGAFLLIFLSLYGIFYYTLTIENILIRRFSLIYIALLLVEITTFISILVVPVVCYKLTDLFYKFNEKDGYEIKFSTDIKVESMGDDIFKKIKLRTKVAIGLFFAIVLAFNFAISIFLTVYFDELFKVNKNIEIVAHRGGGDLSAENSILGMLEASKLGAKWSEIDVQRTKDGYYIINHDATFSRVAGVNKKSVDLTLEEIKGLAIKDLFNKNRKTQPVPTLEEYLDAAKGKIGLFIELKGSTADEKMVEDVVSMVKQKGVEKEVAILSLDYHLIEYTERKYPEMTTGYLYFFSIGDTKNLVSDIFIMEEQEATPEKIEEIHNVGKKAIVWTVNTAKSIEKFVKSDVDGIITDYVRNVKEGIADRNNRTDIEIIFDNILSQ